MPPESSPVARWFEMEIKPHEPCLRGYLRSRVSQSGDIDDVVQETYRRVLHAKSKRTIKSPRGLLFSVARNAVVDLFRRNRPSRTFFVAEMSELDVSSDDDTLETVSLRDEKAVLRAAIRSLPPKCREIFVLRKIEGLSHREIAGRLGISLHTVESQLTKGLHRCQKFFQAKGLMAPKTKTSHRIRPVEVTTS